MHHECSKAVPTASSRHRPRPEWPENVLAFLSVGGSPYLHAARARTGHPGWEVLCGLVDISDPLPSTKVTCEAHLTVEVDAVGETCHLSFLGLLRPPRTWSNWVFNALCYFLVIYMYLDMRYELSLD